MSLEIIIIYLSHNEADRDLLLHNIAGKIVWILFCFIFEHYGLTIGHSFLNFDLEFLWFLHDSVAMAHSAVVLDRMAFASAVRTVHLLAHDHARPHSDLLDDHSLAVAVVALAR